MRVVAWNIQGGRAGLDRIAAELAALDATVVCLTEIRRGHAARLADALGMDGCEGLTWPWGLGNAVLARASRCRRVVLGPRLDPDRRVCVSAMLPSRTTVAGVHLSRDAGRRGRQVARLLEMLPDDAIVGGDLNEPPGGPAWRALASRFDDAWTLAGDGDGATFPAHAPRARIDAVWVPRGARVTACSVPATDLSDHRPVVADVAVG